MRVMWWCAQLATGLLVALAVAGCSQGTTSCAEGATAACACASGGSGTQVCSSSGTFGPCSCDVAGVAACSLQELKCERFATQGRSAWVLHELVRDARAAGRYAEAICLAQHSVDSNDAVLAGASHFETSRAWEALGCRQLAVSEVEASLAVRPEGHAGWRETCEWCITLKAACAQCSRLAPDDAPAAH